RRDGRCPRACAGGVPALGPGLCRDRADGGGPPSQPSAHADHDGRADRHARGADRGQHAGDRAAVRVVRTECHRHRPAAVSGCGTE
ncbi:hypothetical protein LTR94_037299, partial [Friedmanniomyces endolithicus]